MGLTALLVLLWVSTGWCDAIKKCCPQGESLSEDYKCAPSGHEWFYMDFDYGFPECDPILVTVNESDVVSCIDNSLETGSIVGLKCRADPFRFPAPEVHYIRKCCSINRTYDAVQQTCFGERVMDSRPPKEFFNVLMSKFKGIVDIRVGAPECSEGYVLVDYLVHFNKVRREESESIVFQQYGDQPKIFNPDEVCTDFTERHEILVIRACQPAENVCRPNGKLTCVWKCCKDGEAYVGSDTLKCVPTHRPMEPLKFFNMTPKGPVEYEVSSPAFYYNGPCTEKFVLDPKDSPADVFHIGLDGRLFMSTFPNGVGDYCVEDVFNLNESLDGVQVFKCFADYDELIKTQIVVYGYSMIISVVFLFLTLLVYSCLPSLRNLHGKTLMCCLVSLICAFTTHSVIYHWAPEDDSPVALLVCKSLGELSFTQIMSTY